VRSIRRAKAEVWDEPEESRCREAAVLAEDIGDAALSGVSIREFCRQHSSLKFRYRGVLGCIPFGHFASCAIFQTATSKMILVLEVCASLDFINLRRRVMKQPLFIRRTKI
jgi:hypothetical protein